MAKRAPKHERLPFTDHERAELKALFREAREAGNIPSWTEMLAELRAGAACPGSEDSPAA
jgi:hypothetical protein